MSEKKQPNYPSVTALIEAACLRADLSLDRVLADAGLGQENTARQMLAGVIKMPAAWIKPVAERLKLDAAHFLRIWMVDYMPEVLTLVEELASPPLLTEKERRLIASLREHTNGTDAQAIVADGRDLIARGDGMSARKGSGEDQGEATPASTRRENSAADIAKQVAALTFPVAVPLSGMLVERLPGHEKLQIDGQPTASDRPRAVHGMLLLRSYPVASWVALSAFCTGLNSVRGVAARDHELTE